MSRKTRIPRYKEALVGWMSIHIHEKLTYAEAIEKSLYEKLIYRKNLTTKHRLL